MESLKHLSNKQPASSTKLKHIVTLEGVTRLMNIDVAGLQQRYDSYQFR